MISRIRRIRRGRPARAPPARLHVEALEPRILFSANLVPVSIDTGPVDAWHQGIEAGTPQQADSSSAADVTTSQECRIRRELIVVDTDVPDDQRLVDELRAQADTRRQFDVLLLDGSQDGIGQIGDYLESAPVYDTIHLISHGANTDVRLGASRLTMHSIDDYADGLRSWATALSADADLLIYGCDVAATAQGQALLIQLGQLTGADVAAKDDATGNASLGGR